MKKQTNRKLSLKKLAIARINPKSLHMIKGGDCFPTDPTWDEHESDIYCDHSNIP